MRAYQDHRGGASALAAYDDTLEFRAVQRHHEVPEDVLRIRR